MTVSVVVVTGLVTVAGPSPPPVGPASPPLRVKSGPLKPASRFCREDVGAQDGGGVGQMVVYVVTQLVTSEAAG